MREGERKITQWKGKKVIQEEDSYGGKKQNKQNI